MHSHLADVLTRLDDSRALLLSALAGVPSPLRTRRAAPGRWSAAEILEHLSLVESRFASMLAARIEDAMQAGLGPETAAREPLPEEIVRALADRMNRRSAPETAIPTGTLDAAAALAAAEEARRSVRDAVLRADGLALGTLTQSHRLFGELNIYQWIELIAGHERRHVAQIEELRAQLGGESASTA